MHGTWRFELERLQQDWTSPAMWGCCDNCCDAVKYIPAGGHRYIADCHGRRVSDMRRRYRMSYRFRRPAVHFWSLLQGRQILTEATARSRQRCGARSCDRAVDHPHTCGTNLVGENHTKVDPTEAPASSPEWANADSLGEPIYSYCSGSSGVRRPPA